jgi:ubiquitin
MISTKEGRNSMKKLACLLCMALAFSLTISGIVMAAGKPSNKSEKLTAEIVSVDPMAKTITIKDDKGENKTMTAAHSAAKYIRDLKPGDKAVLTCRQDDKGVQTISGFKIVIP